MKYVDARQKALTDYDRPSVAVDLVVFTIVDAQLKVLLVKRKEHPFKNTWSLPGGFVRVGETSDEQGEDLDVAAQRELQEETGITPSRVYLEQLYTFGSLGRTDRAWIADTGCLWSLTRRMLVDLRYQFSLRDTQDAVRDFDRQIARLSWVWRL